MKRIRTLYSPDMMRANLDGRKSQTRRLLPIQPPERHPDSEEPSLLLSTVVYAEGQVHFQYSLGQTFTVPIHRYGRPGDLLLACETHHITGSQVHGDQVQLFGTYTCDGTALNCTLTPAESLLFHGRQKHTGTVPGRFMYTSLSRLAQPITQIRVERLQSITQKDAIAEGITLEMALSLAVAKVPRATPVSLAYYLQGPNKETSPIHLCEDCARQDLQTRTDGWFMHHDDSELDTLLICGSCAKLLETTPTAYCIEQELIRYIQAGSRHFQDHWSLAHCLKHVPYYPTDPDIQAQLPQAAYRLLWDSLNPDHPFTSNPLVVVLSFEPYQPQP